MRRLPRVGQAGFDGFFLSALLARVRRLLDGLGDRRLREGFVGSDHQSDSVDLADCRGQSRAIRDIVGEQYVAPDNAEIPRVFSIVLYRGADRLLEIRLYIGGSEDIAGEPEQGGGNKPQRPTLVLGQIALAQKGAGARAEHIHHEGGERGLKPDASAPKHHVEQGRQRARGEGQVRTRSARARLSPSPRPGA